MESLRDRIPSETLIWPGHEYTVANLMFSLTTSSNTYTKDRLTWAKERGENGFGTIPSTMQLECETNPFLRYDQLDAWLSKMNQVSEMNNAEVVRLLRREKDAFQPTLK